MFHLLIPVNLLRIVININQLPVVYYHFAKSNTLFFHEIYMESIYVNLISLQLKKVQFPEEKFAQQLQMKVSTS